MPEELDILKRDLMRFEIEQKALQKEDDKDSKTRLKRLKRTLQIFANSESLEGRWRNEKEKITLIQEIKAFINGLRIQADQEERKGNLEKVAEIRYAKIPGEEKRLSAAEQSLHKIQKERGLLKEVITKKTSPPLFSRWTNIPVSKMLESEIEETHTHGR